MIRKLKLLISLCCLVCASLEAALAPHEVVLLVNKNSPRSLEIANHYASLRHIPARNVIDLALPGSVLKPAAAMTESEFLQHIWAPANEEIMRRGLGDQVLAWIYSADFPVRVTRAKGAAVSLTGITFVRNKLPADLLVTQGKYDSPLFCGPASRKDPRVKRAESLDSFRFQLGAEMPLPAMMLAHTGARGLSVEEVLDVLRRGAASDGTFPEGPVMFVKRDDIRSTCRDWQYPAVVEAVASLKGRAEILDRYPSGRKGLTGLMDGIHEVVPTPGSLLPGAVAEHLTSHAANFSDHNQTKISAWFRAGATASSGTVTEPFAIAAKFASPFFYAHYLSGCSIIESYYLAVQCPLQLLVAGDPLAAPWAEKFPVVLAGMEDGELKGKAMFYTDTGLQNPRRMPRIQYILDGVLRNDFPSAPMLSVDSSQLSDGYHELRASVRKQGPVAVHSFAVAGFVVNNKGRSIELRGLVSGQKVDLHHPVEAAISGTALPRETGLVSGERRIPLKEGRFDPAVMGAGPVSIQAFAVYEDGMEVRSPPVQIEIGRFNQPPVIMDMASTGAGGFRASAEDPEGDTVHYSWFRLMETGRCSVSGGTMQDGVFAPDPEVPLSLCIFTDRAEGSSGISAGIMVPEGRAAGLLHGAGLLFDVQDEKNYGWFGAAGRTGGWTLGICRDGERVELEAFGAAIPLNTWIELSVHRRPDGVVEGMVNGERVCETAMQKPDWSGKFGLWVERKPLQFRNVMARIQDGGAEISLDTLRGMADSRILLRADDGDAASIKTIEPAGNEDGN